MAIYRITRTDGHDYDEYYRVVVRAGSEKEALDWVCQADEYGNPKFRGFRIDGSNAVAEKVPSTGQAEVILASYLAG